MVDFGKILHAKSSPCNDNLPWWKGCASESVAFCLQVKRSGTTADRIAALTLSVRESGVANFQELDPLLSLMENRKGTREMVARSMEALAELFRLCLLPDRKLKFFSSHPVHVCPHQKMSRLSLFYIYIYCLAESLMEFIGVLSHLYCLGVGAMMHDSARWRHYVSKNDSFQSYYLNARSVCFHVYMGFAVNVVEQGGFCHACIPILWPGCHLAASSLWTRVARLSDWQWQSLCNMLLLPCLSSCRQTLTTQKWYCRQCTLSNYLARVNSYYTAFHPCTTIFLK